MSEEARELGRFLGAMETSIRMLGEKIDFSTARINEKIEENRLERREGEVRLREEARLRDANTTERLNLLEAQNRTHGEKLTALDASVTNLRQEVMPVPGLVSIRDRLWGVWLLFGSAVFVVWTVVTFFGDSIRHFMGVR